MSLTSNLQAAFTRVGTEFKSVRIQAFGSGTGDASGLNTTAKNLKDAINELYARPSGGGSLDSLSDAAVSSPAAGDVLRYDGANPGNFVNVPGTAYFQPRDSDLDAIAALATTPYGQNLLTVASAAALTAGLTSATTGAQGVVLLAAQSDVNTGTDASKVVTSATLQGKLSANYQPLDTDLTSIAALTTTAFGRALLTLADGAGLAGQVRVAAPGLVGVISLATTTEATAGTDTGKAVTSAGVAAAITGRIDTNVNLGTSNVNAPSQAAVKAYADQLIGANDAMVFKGVIDASTNPNYPAGNRGDTYKISVAGKIGGAAGPNVEVGDVIICTTDGTVAGTQAAQGVNWTIVQNNIDGAVTGPATSAAGDFAFFSGTTGKVVQDGGVSLSTDGTLNANSDVLVPTQKAVRTYAQPLDAELSALAGLVSASNKLPYFTGSGTASLADLTAFGRSLVASPDATSAQSVLQVYSQAQIGDPTTDFVSGFVAALL